MKPKAILDRSELSSKSVLKRLAIQEAAVAERVKAVSEQIARRILNDERRMGVQARRGHRRLGRTDGGMMTARKWRLIAKELRANPQFGVCHAADEVELKGGLTELDWHEVMLAVWEERRRIGGGEYVWPLGRKPNPNRLAWVKKQALACEKR